MLDHNTRVQNLQNQIASLENQLHTLRIELAKARRDGGPVFTEQDMPDAPSVSSTSASTLAEEQLARALDGGFPNDWRSEVASALSQSPQEASNKWPLDQIEYKRYGRQLVMPEIGLQGQLKLKASSALIVGVGGLGCPAAAYLAGAGVGTIGLVDGDVVEESNLHRQVLHTTKTVGMEKVDSAMEYIKALNPLVNVIPYKKRLSSDDSLEIFSSYDVVLDCTDTPASRYLISDTCVLLGKPLVSASALRTEGQLMVFNHPPRPQGDPEGGPCYRCIFPKPSSPESVVSCGDGGILGPVVGVMGVLQALEAIKLMTAGSSSNGYNTTGTNGIASAFADMAMDPPSLLLFSAYSSPQFRSIKLRRRSPKCATCSSHATVTADALTSGSMDYIQFCGITNPINLLSPEERVSAIEYGEARKRISLGGKQHRLIDVREKVQFDLCHLYGSINFPFSLISSLRGQDSAKAPETFALLGQLESFTSSGSGDPIYVVCRLGNDSQIAVQKFKELGVDAGGKTWIGDIRGGLRAWRENVDPSFPDY